MSFRHYLRWDGGLAVLSGVALVVFGLVEGREDARDAVFGGAIMLLGTATYMFLRHRLGPRAPGRWYTARPLAAAGESLPPHTRGALLARLLAAATAGATVALGLSFATGSWLTYMDLGVWAVAVGAIKIGPAAAAVARRETVDDCTYRVAARSPRGTVQLTTDRSPPIHHDDESETTCA